MNILSNKYKETLIDHGDQTIDRHKCGDDEMLSCVFFVVKNSIE